MATINILNIGEKKKGDFVKSHDINSIVNKINEIIPFTNESSKKFSGYTPTNMLATINSSAITSGGNIEVQDKLITGTSILGTIDGKDFVYGENVDFSGETVGYINGTALTWGGSIYVKGEGGGTGGTEYFAGKNININSGNIIAVSGLATINGSAITEGGNLVIESGFGITYTAGENIEISSDNKISAVLTGISAYTENKIAQETARTENVYSKIEHTHSHTAITDWDNAVQVVKVNSAITTNEVYVTGGTLQIINSGQSDNGNEINITCEGQGDGDGYVNIKGGDTLNLEANNLNIEATCSSDEQALSLKGDTIKMNAESILLTASSAITSNCTIITEEDVVAYGSSNNSNSLLEAISSRLSAIETRLTSLETRVNNLE